MKEYYEQFLKLETTNKMMLASISFIILTCLLTGNFIAVIGWSFLLYTKIKILKG